METMEQLKVQHGLMEKKVKPFLSMGKAYVDIPK